MSPATRLVFIAIVTATLSLKSCSGFLFVGKSPLLGGQSCLHEPPKPSKSSSALRVSNTESTIAQLKAMAAQLRAEAAQLEAVRQEQVAQAIAEVFQTFDTNNDGSISIEELREGLARELKASVTEEQARQLMSALDRSGDGALQLDEFTTVEDFRNKLEMVIRDERTRADEAAVAARDAKLAAEAADKLASEIAVILNDRPPTTTDRLFSLLPYLLPLIDSLDYGKVLLVQIGSNPVTEFLANTFNTYQSIPFSGLVAFFILSSFSNNLSLNRLIRFNLQQAILIDISLLAPGLLGGTLTAFLPITPELANEASIATFAVIATAILYCVGSSLLGITPNKLPLISENVERRMPSVSNFVDTMMKLEESKKNALSEIKKQKGPDDNDETKTR